MQSVERALDILREVGDRPGGLVDVAGRVQLPTSTAARLLITLENGGALRRDANGVYRIGPDIVAMAGPNSGADVVSVARLHMIELAEELGEAVALSLPSGTTTTTVEQIDSPKPVRAEDWTGTQVPLHAGCVGLTTLAFWADQAIDAYLDSPLEKCSVNTVTAPGTIWRRVAALRAGRLLWTHGEFVDGLSSLAAPLLNELGQPVAALYTYGPSYRYPVKGDTGRGSDGWVTRLVHQRAVQISADLGHVPVSEHARPAAS